MPRKQQGWVTFQTSDQERQILEQFCQLSQRSKTDILRELVRGLSQSAVEAPPVERSAGAEHSSQVSPSGASEVPMVKVSARNILRGRVKQLTLGTVNAEVVVEIAPGCDLISTITRSSAEQLGLHSGKQVYAVIKSSNIMIAE